MLVEDKEDAFKISLIIPVCSPDQIIFKKLIESLLDQTVKVEILLIDSSPNNMALQAPPNMRIIKISPYEFHHGQTRNMGVEKTDGDIIVFMTQDALPCDNYSIEKLITPFFEDKRIGATYGRQLPRQGAGAIEAHSRLYNYPPVSHIKSHEDIPRLGIKACFMSNSFSAYRRSAFLDVGGFSSNLIMAEDMHIAARLLLKGWKIAYCADAMVYHSHNYTVCQEFKRYFDIGVFHSQEAWIQETFGKAEGEGKRFILSELRYLMRHNPFLIPSALLRNIMKFTAYRLGKMEHWIPLWLKRILSMHKNFWLNPHESQGHKFVCK